MGTAHCAGDDAVPLPGGNGPPVQERLLLVTEEPPGSAFFAVAARALADGLAEQVRQFVSEHPDTVLVAVDTFQMVRRGESEASYANDYQEVPGSQTTG